MSIITAEIEQYMENASWIRRMFEAGRELKTRVGADNVFDFSLGNPDLPPPREITPALHAQADTATEPCEMGYVPNAGLPSLRAKLATRLAAEQRAPVAAEHIIITCGAAGGINALFRAILEPGDEVITPAPYFVEYGFYAGNYGGILKTVAGSDLHFDLDLDGLAASLTEKTRVVIVNSPNNPTGQIYTLPELEKLAALLREHSDRIGRPVFLVSDEPYRFLTFDDAQVPPILPLYEHAVVVGSYSKRLSLAGERIGYLVANPSMPEVETLMAGVTLTNRILGFVNAPVIGQRLVEELIDAGVDINTYDQRRQAMATVLQEAGIEFSMPKGAFYFFPIVPGDKQDDKAFVDCLLHENILAVPGKGFGAPGYFRLTFCVSQPTIEASTEAFCRAVSNWLD